MLTRTHPPLNAAQIRAIRQVANPVCVNANDDNNSTHVRRAEEFKRYAAVLN